MTQPTKVTRKKATQLYKFLIKKVKVLSDNNLQCTITQYCNLMCGAIAYAHSINQIDLDICDTIIRQIEKIEDSNITTKERRLLIVDFISYLEGKDGTR